MDEDGNPIDGAVVDASVLVQKLDIPIMWGPSRNHFDKLQTISDKSGIFVLKDFGHAMTIIVEKGGYTGYSPDEPRWSVAADSLHKSIYDADIKHPVIFRMRKKEGSDTGRK